MRSQQHPGSSITSELSFLQEYLRARRWTLEVSQETVASYMCSNACTVSTDETKPLVADQSPHLAGNVCTVSPDESKQKTWNRSAAWDFRRGAAYGLLEIGATVEKMMVFWHEVNKVWVAVPHDGLFIPDPYYMTYVQIVAEDYSDIAAAMKDPRYQRYLEGCDRMHEAAERRQRA